MTDSSFKIKNTLVVNAAFTANSTVVGLGNVAISPNTLYVGNNSVNATVNSTSLYIIKTTGTMNVAPEGITSNATTFAISGNVQFQGTYNSATANVQTQTLTITGGATTWNLANGPIAFVTANQPFSVSTTNLLIGTYILHVIQDSTGGRSITWGSNFKWTAGVKPPAGTNPGQRDIYTFTSDGTNMYGSFIPDVR